MMADKKKMSVADILAAARKADGEAADDTEKPEEGSAKQAAAEKPAAEKAAAPKPSAGARPSVADMLAMARGEKAGGAKASAKAPAKPDSIRALSSKNLQCLCLAATCSRG